MDPVHSPFACCISSNPVENFVNLNGKWLLFLIVINFNPTEKQYDWIDINDPFYPYGLT